MHARPRILVVCYGNLCRSPMAEGLLRAKLPAEWEVCSAGTHAFGGAEPTDTACAVMRHEADIEIDNQRSRRLTAEMIEAADHVFTMSAEQADIAARHAPNCRDKIRLLGAFAPASGESNGSADPGGAVPRPLEIPDPMGGDYDEYHDCMRRLDQATERCVEWLLAGAQPSDALPSHESPRWPFPRRT